MSPCSIWSSSIEDIRWGDEMQISENGLNLTKSFESCDLHAYPDEGGVWTIGWGHTSGVEEGDTCTQEQADAWLREDMQNAQNIVNRLVVSQIVLTQNEFDALVDFVFNIGGGNFAKSTVFRDLMKTPPDYNGAANAFGMWNKVKGEVSEGLVRRRAAEKELFNTPEAA